MKNIYYPSADFHKAVKRNKPTEVYYYRDIWFYTQKAVICYTPQNDLTKNAMITWLKNQNIEVVNEFTR